MPVLLKKQKRHYFAKKKINVSLRQKSVTRIRSPFNRINFILFVKKTRPGICYEPSPLCFLVSSFDSFEEEKLRIQIIQSSRQYSLVILLSLFTLVNIEMHSI